jgi:hypothetical protein
MSKIKWTVGAGCTTLALAVLAAWLLGRVCSDRWTWSQWLLWIPTPGALLAVGLGLLAARNRRALVWAAAALAVLVYFWAVEHRFHRVRARGQPALRLLHATERPIGREARDRFVDRLAEIGADTFVLSTPLGRHDVKRFESHGTDHRRIITIWPFTLLTRLTVVEARPLVARDGTYIAMFRLDAGEQLGGTVTLYAVDLPSDPKLSRFAIARTTRRLLEGSSAPPPDIVVGDFNVTRGSAALKTLFPGFSHAWDQAGRGYGATFHRAVPLYHIDHTLLADTVRARDYALIDLEAGRHLAQLVELLPTDSFSQTH